MIKSRKRSNAIKLVAMGAGILALTACDEQVDVGIFETAEQCAQVLDSESCDAKFEQAQEMHAKVSPKYVIIPLTTVWFIPIFEGKGTDRWPKP